MSRSVVLGLALVSSLALGAPVGLARSPETPAPPAAAVRPAVVVSDDAVREIAAQLRCVVCQNLSVADSPSETAYQMREIIHDRLAAGETPKHIIAYFVDKYGPWILLSPPKKGFGLLVWVVPFAGLLGGFVLVGLVVRRWSRRARTSPVETRVVDEAMRQRIRREMEEMGRE